MKDPTGVYEVKLLSYLRVWYSAAEREAAITLTHRDVGELLDEIQAAMTEEYHAGVERL